MSARSLRVFFLASLASALFTACSGAASPTGPSRPRVHFDGTNIPVDTSLSNFSLPHG